MTRCRRDRLSILNYYSDGDGLEELNQKLKHNYRLPIKDEPNNQFNQLWFCFMKNKKNKNLWQSVNFTSTFFFLVFLMETKALFEQQDE
jgi:hypothetical protein